MAGAGPRAVPLPAVTDPAQEEQLLAIRSGTDNQPQRVHALPRSGRGGWTITPRCAKKGAATRALPRCDAARGSGVTRLRTLTPQRRQRERSTSTRGVPATAFFGWPVANSALSGDRRHARTWARCSRKKTTSRSCASPTSAAGPRATCSSSHSRQPLLISELCRTLVIDRYVAEGGIPGDELCLTRDSYASNTSSSKYVSRLLP